MGTRFRWPADFATRDRQEVHHALESIAPPNAGVLIDRIVTVVRRRLPPGVTPARRHPRPRGRPQGGRTPRAVRPAGGGFAGSTRRGRCGRHGHPDLPPPLGRRHRRHPADPVWTDTVDFVGRLAALSPVWKTAVPPEPDAVPRRVGAGAPLASRRRAGPGRCLGSGAGRGCPGERGPQELIRWVFERMRSARPAP